MGALGNAEAVLALARTRASESHPIAWFFALSEAARDLGSRSGLYLGPPPDLCGLLADAEAAAVRTQRARDAVTADTDELERRVRAARTWARKDRELLPWMEEELADRQARATAA